MIPITFSGVDALFIYTQFLNETILEIEDDDAKRLKEFADYCHSQVDASKANIKKIEEEYWNHTPIW